jgi:hypothetical protein
VFRRIISIHEHTFSLSLEKKRQDRKTVFMMVHYLLDKPLKTLQLCIQLPLVEEEAQSMNQAQATRNVR